MVADYGVVWKQMMIPLSTSSPTEWPQVAPHQIAAFFASPDLGGRKDEICDIGRRLWQRGQQSALDGRRTGLRPARGGHLQPARHYLASKEESHGVLP